MLAVFNPDLEDLDWISELDWSEQNSVNGRWISEHLHLADVATRLATSVCSVWPMIPSFLARASNRPSGPLVDTAEAFAADDTAIHSHHARLSDLMRRHADHLGVGIARSDAIARDEWDAILSKGGLPESRARRICASPSSTASSGAVSTILAASRSRDHRCACSHR